MFHRTLEYINLSALIYSNVDSRQALQLRHLPSESIHLSDVALLTRWLWPPFIKPSMRPCITISARALVKKTQEPGI